MTPLWRKLLGVVVLSALLTPAEAATAAPETVMNVANAPATALPTPDAAGWAEPTAAALGPGRNRHCWGGRLFFQSMHRVVMTSLGGDAATTHVFPTGGETFEPALIFDNHIVTTKGGQVVATYEAITWNDNLAPKPDWWETTKDWPVAKGGRKHPGGRGIIYVWKSRDCGATWTAMPSIDAATQIVNSVAGHCGTPHTHLTDTDPSDNIDYGEHSSAGGWDGHSLHADPYSGDLILATKCGHAPADDTKKDEIQEGVVLRSTDGGASWSQICFFTSDLLSSSGSFFRVPITTRKSGEVAFSYRAKGTLRLVTIKNPGRGQCGQGDAVFSYVTGFDSEAIVNETGAKNPLSTSIARPGPGDGDHYTLAVHDVLNGKHLRHVLLRYQAGQAPVTTPHVSLEAPPGHVIWGTLIEGVGTFARFNLAYFLQTVPERTGTRLQVGYRVVGKSGVVAEGIATRDANGNPYTWQPTLKPDGTAVFLGDYMGGTSYSSGQGGQQRTHHVLAWVQNQKPYFTTVTLRHVPANPEKDTQPKPTPRQPKPRQP